MKLVSDACFVLVSSTFVRIPEWGSVLLDAGEGTWGQLVRLLGDDPERSSGVWEALRDLKCIFLSHIHGDHHIGAAKILAMRQKVRGPRSQPDTLADQSIVDGPATARASVRDRCPEHHIVPPRIQRDRGSRSRQEGRSWRSDDSIRRAQLEDRPWVRPTQWELRAVDEPWIVRRDNTF